MQNRVVLFTLGNWTRHLFDKPQNAVNGFSRADDADADNGTPRGICPTVRAIGREPGSVVLASEFAAE